MPTTQLALAAARKRSELLAATESIETRSFIRSVVSRIVIHAANVDLSLDKQALRSSLLGSAGSPTPARADGGNGHLSLKIETCLLRCGREVRLVVPANSGRETPVRPLPSLIKAVARAHDWHERILRGQFTGTRSIARATGLDERYVSRILQCAFLAPDIVERILDGRQSANMTLEKIRTRVPLDWAAQRQLLDLSGRQARTPGTFGWNSNATV